MGVCAKVSSQLSRQQHLLCSAQSRSGVGAVSHAFKTASHIFQQNRKIQFRCKTGWITQSKEQLLVAHCQKGERHREGHRDDVQLYLASFVTAEQIPSGNGWLHSSSVEKILTHTVTKTNKAKIALEGITISIACTTQEISLLFSAVLVCCCCYSVASFGQRISGKLWTLWRGSRDSEGLGNTTCKGGLKELHGLGQKPDHWWGCSNNLQLHITALR